MKEWLLLLVFVAICTASQGQVDTIRVSAVKAKLDSIPSTIKTDSLERAANSVLQTFDSLRNLSSTRRFTDSLAIDGWAKELKAKIKSRYSDSLIQQIEDNMLMDNIPSPRVLQYTDSIAQHRDSLMGVVTASQQTLQRKISTRHTDWMEKAKGAMPQDSLSKALSSRLGTNQNTPSVNTSLPDLPSTDIPQLAAMPELHALAPADFGELQLPGELLDIGGETTIPDLDQLKQWGTLPELPNINATLPGELSSVADDPGKAAMGAAENVAEVKAVTGELKNAEQLSKPLTDEQMKALADPSAVAQQAQQSAVDHMAGHGAEVNGAMSQMSRYKKKYSSLGSLAEIKKNDWLPRNGLKGKPFRERFRMGMNAGVRSKGDTVLMDFYPNASYRITGRFEAGLAMMYQLRVCTTPLGLNQSHPLWGISTFAVVRTFKSVSLRLELEGDSWPRTSSQSEPVQRDWRWRSFAGIQSSFKLGKRWTGLVQMLYGFDASLKDVFPEGLRARVGVQYRLKERKKTT